MASIRNARAPAPGQDTVVRLPIRQPRVKLTARSVRNLPGPAQGRERVYRDQQQPGLALVVDRRGRRTFIVTGRTTSGRTYRLRVADALAVDLGDARRAARAILGAAACGRDPGHERRAERAARRAARRPPADERSAQSSMREAVSAFLRARERDLRPASWWSYRSALERLALPVLGERPIAEIERADIDRLHAAVTSSSGPIQANRLRSILSGVFSFAERQGLVATNCVRGSILHRERDRERVLSPDELRRFLEAARARPDVAGRLIEFLLMTACRKGEALAARWRDFDLDGASWGKPPSSTKSGRTHRIPLSAEAVELLLALGPGSPEARVFGISGSTLQRAHHAVCREAGIDGATLHDLRRTAATLLCAAGVPMPTLGRLLGHAPGSTITTRIYARSTNAAEVDAAAALGKLLRPS
jgi:integrase